MAIDRKIAKKTKELKQSKKFFKLKPGQSLFDEDGNLVVKGVVSDAEQKMITDSIPKVKEGGLMEATAKLKAKGFEDGGMVVKDKVVAIDTSPNSGLITTKGFGAGRRT